MNDREREEIIDLCNACFGESPDFTRFYFNAKYRPGRALVVRRDGRPAAALLLVPYAFSRAGRLLDMAYISWACTRADCRGEGLMTRLLADAFRHARSRGFALAALIPGDPSLFDYYRRFGFSPVFERVAIEERGEGPVDAPRQVTEIAPDDARAFLAARVWRADNRVQHDREDFTVISASIADSGGALLAARAPGGAIEGVAVVAPDPGKIIVEEWASDAPAARHSLVRAIADRWLGRVQEWRGPTGSVASRHHHGMARLLNVSAFLSDHAARHPGETLAIEVLDEIIPENRGLFILRDGACHRAHSTAAPVVVMNIDQLTSFLLQDDPSLPPYMSLMLD
ncbi:MAG: GNAT family N-acetyltransferase [Odoribacteraceae bacterium]|jgi:GNAT superfamily N-acetyltransferase|nr:GNAT family N-acetyltransferase [Odoribacteraceae bacterium]